MSTHYKAAHDYKQIIVVNYMVKCVLVFGRMVFSSLFVRFIFSLFACRPYLFNILFSVLILFL